jgi:dienelactone hydrolase
VWSFRRWSPVLLLLVTSVARAQTAHPPPDQVKASFLKLLDRPKVPLDARARATMRGRDGRVTERIEFATEKRADGAIERVPALLVRPADDSKPSPAVIVLHGTGGSKDSLRPWLDELVGRGFIAVAIDARFHGERSGGAKGAAAYNEAIITAWRADPEAGFEQTYPFYYDTCWDIWRTIDYLQTRTDVDPDRIGMVGISMGGIETWLAAAVDDRVKVAVPALAVQSFRWSLDNNQWQARARTIKAAHDAAAADLGRRTVNDDVCRALWNKIVPGILDQYDCPSMIRLFAGRALLITSGERDPNCPIDGAGVAFAAARRAFKDANAADHLKIMVAPGSGHMITPRQHAAIMSWLVQWLKPETKETS